MAKQQTKKTSALPSKAPKKVALVRGIKNSQLPGYKKKKSNLPPGRIKKASLLAVIDKWKNED